jgi:hypothetical protein
VTKAVALAGEDPDLSSAARAGHPAISGAGDLRRRSCEAGSDFSINPVYDAGLSSAFADDNNIK